MAHVSTIINLKGGVGKSTLTYGLAMVLAHSGKRVLVFDLDPQSNSSVLFLGNQRWNEANPTQTLVEVFKNELEGKFDENKSLDILISTNGDISDLRSPVTLAASSPQLMDIQERLPLMRPGDYFLETPVNIIQRRFGTHFMNFDYVLFDCPPSLGLIPMNALLISDSYIIPTIADRVSTSGIESVLARVSKINRFRSHELRFLGIVISKYREQSSMHNTVLRELNTKYTATLFRQRIAESNAVSELGNFRDIGLTIRQKFSSAFDSFRIIAEEFTSRAGIETAK